MEICKAGYTLQIFDLLSSVLITPMCWQWEWLQQLNDHESSGSSCGHGNNLLFLFSSSSRKYPGNGREKPFTPISNRRLMILLLLLFVSREFHSKNRSRRYPIKLKALLGSRTRHNPQSQRVNACKIEEVVNTIQTNGWGGKMKAVQSRNLWWVWFTVLFSLSKNKTSHG